MGWTLFFSLWLTVVAFFFLSSANLVLFPAPTLHLCVFVLPSVFFFLTCLISVDIKARAGSGLRSLALAPPTAAVPRRRLRLTVVAVVRKAPGGTEERFVRRSPAFSSQLPAEPTWHQQLQPRHCAARFDIVRAVSFRGDFCLCSNSRERKMDQTRP